MFGFPALDLCQPCLEALFVAFFCREVVFPADEVVRHGLHGGQFVRVVVRKLVTLAVAEVFHQPGGGVAQVQRHGVVAGLLDVFRHFAARPVDGIGFWREGEVHHGFGQMHVAFGHADVAAGLEDVDSKCQRVGIRQAAKTLDPPSGENTGSTKRRKYWGRQAG